MKGKAPLAVLEKCAAHEVAKQLHNALEGDDEVTDVLIEFHAEMSSHKNDSFARLEVVGVGVLHEVFVWWMEDDSLLLVGWKGEDEVAIGVLPPDTRFTALPIFGGDVNTIH